MAAAGGAPTSGGGSAPEASGEGSTGGAPELGPSTRETCVTEVCNGHDDDCDGAVDEGCPSGALVGNAVQRGPLGDSQGGVVFADTCLDGELLVGVNVSTANWLDQVAGICEKYALSVNTQSIPYQYSLTLTDKRALTAHPPVSSTTTSVTTQMMCREGTAMVGLRISQQHSAFGAATDQIIVPQISVDCAEPMLNLSAGAASSPALQWQNLARIGPVSGLAANNQAWFETDALGDSQILVGIHGAAGAWVDRIGLIESSFVISVHAE